MLVTWRDQLLLCPPGFIVSLYVVFDVYGVLTLPCSVGLLMIIQVPPARGPKIEFACAVVLF